MILGTYDRPLSQKILKHKLWLSSNDLKLSHQSIKEGIQQSEVW